MKHRLTVVAAVCSILVASAALAEARKIVVAKDGTGDFATINEALAASKGATKAKPVDILIKPGTYTETVTTHDWVNLIGEDRDKCILTFHGGTKDIVHKHTIWATTNSTIKNLTIIGTQVKYCIHSDGGRRYVLNIENCLLRRVYPKEFRRAYQAGFGIGQRGGQHIVMRDCTIEADLPIYWHNWNDQPSSCSMTLERCVLKGKDNALGMYLLGSKQRDFYIIHDSELHSAKESIKYVNMRHTKTARPWIGNSEVELIGSGNTLKGIVGATMRDDSAKRVHGPDLEERRRIPMKPIDEDYGTAEGKAASTKSWRGVPKGKMYHLGLTYTEDALVLTNPSAEDNPGPFGYVGGPSGPATEPPLTLELRMKHTLVKGGNAQLYYCCNPSSWLIQWQPDKVRDGSNPAASIAVDTAQWQTYRLVAASADLVRLFVDGVEGEGILLRPSKHGARYFQYRVMGRGSVTEIDWMKLRANPPAK